MMRFIKAGLLILSLTMTVVANAQEKVEMADFMRSNGRIYVVIAVMVMILLGLILYLIRLDKKISRMEKGDK